MGTAEATKADELWGSLGLSKTSAGTARKKAYVAMLSAAVLDERSRGVSLGDIERRWGLPGLEGTEESWRDTALGYFRDTLRSSRFEAFTIISGNAVRRPMNKFGLRNARWAVCADRHTTYWRG